MWEGLRLVKGRLISLDAHMDRLFEGARSIDLDIGLDRAGVVRALQDTLNRNGILTIDVPAKKLTVSVINTYLELKGRGAL